MWHKKNKRFKKRRYQKAPSQFLRALMRQSRRLRALGLVVLAIGLTAVLISLPQLNWRGLSAASKESWQKISALPRVLEKQTFAVFDWGEMAIGQLSANWQDASDKNALAMFSEAGQSAQKSPTPTLEQKLLNEPETEQKMQIEIPKLQINEQVLINIDPNKPDLYVPALKEGVAHALGSALPGDEQMIFIFGHSTNSIWNVEAYNAVFYQIKELSFGDEIILHWQGQQFAYRVIGLDIVVKDDAAYVNQRHNQDILLLQTCWPPGTTWQRLFVTAEPISSLEQDMRAIFGEF